MPAGARNGAITVSDRRLRDQLAELPRLETLMSKFGRGGANLRPPPRYPRAWRSAEHERFWRSGCGSRPRRSRRSPATGRCSGAVRGRSARGCSPRPATSSTRTSSLGGRAARSRRRREKAAKLGRDEAVLAETGIRVAARASRCSRRRTCSRPSGFEQIEVDDDPSSARRSSRSTATSASSSTSSVHPLLRPAVPGVRRPQLRQAHRDRRPARPRRAAHRRTREDRLPGRASSCCAPARA